MSIKASSWRLRSGYSFEVWLCMVSKVDLQNASCISCLVWLQLFVFLVLDLINLLEVYLSVWLLFIPLIFRDYYWSFVGRVLMILNDSCSDLYGCE